MALNVLQAGRMDRRVTIQTFTEAQDGFGSPVKTWADLATVPTVWAEVVPLSGSELFAAQQIYSEADTRFRLRYRDDLSVEMRIVYDGENYDIRYVGEIGRHEGLLLLAKREQT